MPFSSFSIKILFIQKIQVVQRGLFVTYLYVYGFEGAFIKFPNSPNVHFLCWFGNGAESGRTILQSTLFKSRQVNENIYQKPNTCECVVEDESLNKIHMYYLSKKQHCKQR